MTKASALLAAALMTIGACGTETSTDLQPVTFMAGFNPQANLPFVGVYVAEAKGFFEEQGLDVEIQHSAGGGEHLQLLAAGTVDITTQDAAVLMQRRADPGIPLVSIGLIGQTGQQAYVALADSGLQEPSDWAGRSIGFKGTPPPDVFAILDAVGLTPADVDLINVGFDPRVLTEGQVDVYPVFKSNEPNLLANQGFELVMWEAADYGIPTLGLTYVTTEKATTADPAMLSGFMEAVIEGIEYAADNREEAVEIVLTHTGPQADPAHQRFILDTELADAMTAVTDVKGIGWQTHEQWSALRDHLVAYEALPGGTSVDRAFTTEFLPAP